MNRLSRAAWTLVVALAASSCGKDPVVAPQQAAPTRLTPPLCDAQVGEWLRLESGRDAQLLRVVDAGDYYVDVETTTYQNESPVGSPQRQRWSRNSFGLPPDECVIRTIDSDRIQVGDKSYACWRIYTTTRTGQENYFWISDEVPVHGMLKYAGIRKGVVDEAHAVKLADFGFTPK
jgi:hypothetical protein